MAGHAAEHAHDEVGVQGLIEQAHVDQRLQRGDMPEVEALVLGLDAQPLHRLSSSTISSKGFWNTNWNTNCLREREYLA